MSCCLKFFKTYRSFDLPHQKKDKKKKGKKQSFKKNSEIYVNESIRKSVAQPNLETIEETDSEEKITPVPTSHILYNIPTVIRVYSTSETEYEEIFTVEHDDDTRNNTIANGTLQSNGNVANYHSTRSDSGIAVEENEEPHPSAQNYRASKAHEATEDHQKPEDNRIAEEHQTPESHRSSEYLHNGNHRGSFLDIDDNSDTSSMHSLKVSMTVSERPSELYPPMTLSGRKEGIISEPIVEGSMKKNNIEFYEKNEETVALIKKAISENDFLNNMMDKDRLDVVIKAMAFQQFEANSFIINEGEDGNHFYVSEEGEFEVLKDGDIKKKFGEGVVFGELAILYKAKRFASIRVTTTSKVWVLERKVFQRIMMETGSQEREQNITFLRSVPVLKGLSLDILQKLSDLLVREFYETGSTIVRQGDAGDKFYIIRGGRVTVAKRNSQGLTKIVDVLKRGDHFGQHALIDSDKRLASVIAQEPGAECLTLDRNAFKNYLGSIAELKNKPVDQHDIELPTAKVINTAYNHIQLEDLKYVGTLGFGGFGRVELVHYQEKESFALKILKKHDVVNQGQIQHAYCEKEVMSLCDCPFIVSLYKTFRDNKYIYFMMEPCLGGDVFSQLQRAKQFDNKTALFATGCVIEALEYLHSRQIIYRDLKPENLMIDSDGYVKLVDFGFAKLLKPTDKTWTFSGTPEYVAPEIILNKGHDRAVDYWALGVFIHELLVGKPPFRGKDHMRLFNAILRGIDVIQISPKVPKSAQNLIKALCRQISTDRLGYQRKGIAEIKKHSWFESFDWNRLHNRSIPSPLRRPITSPTDLSNFEKLARQGTPEPPDELSGWDIDF